jgi:hypothetical protein
LFIRDRPPAAADRRAGEGSPPGGIRVIPPGYDPDLFAAAADAPDPFPDLGRPRVGYIGRIAPQKDVSTLISAFGRLTTSACLLIVGDGPGRRAAEAQARPLAGPVRFTGFAPHARIPAVLRHIDLLVLATRYEELPSVLIEAMAAGLPVIASRVGGIPALVHHDVNGLLVPPGDPPGPRRGHLPRSGRAGHRPPASRRRPAYRATVHLARASPPGRRGLPAADSKTAASLNRSRRHPQPAHPATRRTAAPRHVRAFSVQGCDA